CELGSIKPYTIFTELYFNTLIDMIKGIENKFIFHGLLKRLNKLLIFLWTIHLNPVPRDLNPEERETYTHSLTTIADS
ncbi:MAG: hypothetical protein ACK5G8_07890, partial [Flavobacteriales bacterium]